MKTERLIKLIIKAEHEMRNAVIGIQASKKAPALLALCKASLPLAAEVIVMRDLLGAIVRNRSKCFIPNDVEGMHDWDERVQSALTMYDKRKRKGK